MPQCSCPFQTPHTGTTTTQPFHPHLHSPDALSSGPEQPQSQAFCAVKIPTPTVRSFHTRLSDSSSSSSSRRDENCRTQQSQISSCVNRMTLNMRLKADVLARCNTGGTPTMQDVSTAGSQQLSCAQDTVLHVVLCECATYLSCKVIDILQQSNRQVLRHATWSEVSCMHTGTTDTLIKLHQLLTLLHTEDDHTQHKPSGK